MPLPPYLAKPEILHFEERSLADGAGSGTVVRPADPTCNTGIDQSALPVFQQNWWLEIARGTEEYHEARVFKNQMLVGSLPYHVRRTKIGTRWGAAPDWSHLGGPVVSQSLSQAEKLGVLAQLIAQLPRNISYGFVCSPYTDDAGLIRRAFAGAGFAHFAEMTCSQPPGQADVMSRVKRKHRLHLEAAQRALDVVEIGEHEFIDFYSRNLTEAALAARFPLDTARALIAAGRMLDAPQVRVIAAKGKAAGGPLEAAIACAWDKVRYYYWMSTRRGSTANRLHDVSHPDAIKLLIADAMAHAQSLGLIFDTDGCSTPGSKMLYKELLRIPNEEFREVFERVTSLQQWYIAQQQSLDRFAAVRYVKRKLKMVPSIWVPGRPESSSES